jgi:hypothetical protein
MASGSGIELTIDQKQMQALAVRLSAEEDGKKLRLQLARDLRAAIAPAVSQIKDAAQSIPRTSSGLAHNLDKKSDSQALGAAIAARIGTQVRFSGRSTGVSVKARKKGMPRGFALAAKRFNARAPFRHMVFGDPDVWVEQRGIPGYFDKPLHEGRIVYRAAIRQAMQAMADRIAKR